MRKLVLVLFLALAMPPASISAAAAQDVLDFGDPLPLPPPPIDDSTAATPGGSLFDTPAVPPLPLPPTTAAAPAPAVTPAAPPLALPPAAPDNVTTIDLPDAVDAASAPAAAAAAAAPAGPERPLAGKISGGRVNVRAGPNTQYESIAVITTGSPITILSKHEDWYKIVYPADQLASIHKNYVDAEITGEIPEAGVTGVVNQDNADVHAFYWDKSTVVGKLNKGDPVTIKQERGQWYRIMAPNTARAYVFAEYVRVDGGETVPVDTAEAPSNPAIDLTAGQTDGTGRLMLSENDRRAAALKEAYFARLQEQHRRQEEEEVREVNRLEEALDGLEARLRAVDAETANQLSYPVQVTSIGASTWAPPDPLYGGFTGWVENIGRVGGSPANFRLTKGGEIRFYLRSDRFNLGDFVGRRVWLNGNIELAAGATANILNVDQIRVLTELEIAQGLPQPPAGGAVTETVTTQTFTTTQPVDPFFPTVPGYVVDGSPNTTVTTWDTTYASPSGTWETTTVQTTTTPEFPTSPSALPDHVGYGAPAPIQGGYAPIVTGGPGEVQSDWYESPFVSEVGP